MCRDCHGLRSGYRETRESGGREADYQEIRLRHAIGGQARNDKAQQQSPITTLEGRIAGINMWTPKQASGLSSIASPTRRESVVPSASSGQACRQRLNNPAVKG
ncbi:MAG: hypothetical protein NTX52_08335 [Planctomycetota bacterium]|nr:hypothetical protein [Planctomycetota bacterium]